MMIGSHLDTIGQTSSAVVITRPPEIIACFQIMHPTRSVYVIFDSHPRPKHPEGAALIFNTSLIKTAHYLSELMYFDERLLNAGNGLQWQAQLLANVSGHYFKSTTLDLNKPEVAQQIAVDANLALLEMKAEMAQLKSQKSFLESEKESLTKKVDALERQSEEWRAERTRLKGKQVVRNNMPPARIFLNTAERAHMSSPSGAALSKTEDTKVHNANLKVPPNLAQRLEGATSRTYARALDSHQIVSKGTDAEPKDSKGSSHAYALELQRQFAEEDAMISALTATFACGVCMDDLPVEDLAQIESCQHSFCRDCLRQHATIKVKEHRFPILCPTCAANRHAKEPGSESYEITRTDFCYLLRGEN